MAQPWQTIESVPTDEGRLELRRRGQADYLITVDGRVLMNSAANRSELALGVLGCGHLRRRRDARVLIGGLGMGFTLRAALDAVAPTAQVLVAELNPTVVEWCRGPLAALAGRVVEDPRVEVEVGDVTSVIRRAAGGPSAGRFDAIVLDLYEGPHGGRRRDEGPLYGRTAIETTRAALNPGGVFAVWGEGDDPGFVKRLKLAGFSVRRERPGRGGLRHMVYVARAGRTPPRTRPRR